MGTQANGQRIKAIDLIAANRRAWVQDDVGFRRLFEALEKAGPAKAPDQEAAAAMTSRGLRSFRRHFCRIAGRPWRAFLPEWRFQEARRLVENPIVGISEVRTAVGIRSARTFSRGFKARFGISPKALRRQGLHRQTGQQPPERDGGK